jgi:triphosphoribosyl-dephospho-CoA synthase
MAAGKLRTQINGSPDIFPGLEQCVMELVQDTSADDSVELYRAFSKAGVRINNVDDLDLADPSSIDEIRERGTTLYRLMEISSSYDMIAREWTLGYQLTFKCANSILEKYRSMSINDALVRTFLEILAGNPDTFIQTKFDHKRAEEVSGRARDIVERINSSGFEIAKPDIEQFDEQLLSERVNPGSTADIIIAGLFVALVGGLKF